MNKFKAWKLLFISMIFYAFVYFIYGIYLGFHNLFYEKYDSISSPIALFFNDTIGFFFRLIDPITRDPDGFIIIICFIFPITLFILFIIYFISKRKLLGYKKIISLSSVFLVIIIFTDMLYLLLIPGLIEWGIFRIKATLDINKGIELLKKEEIIVDPNKITTLLNSDKKINLYLDYGKGGVVLAELLKDKKLFSFYESFYLPIFFSKYKNIKLDDSIDNSNILSIDNNLIITNIKDKESLKKIILSISNHLLINTYSDYISIDNSKLKNFSIFDDKDYTKYYNLKIINDLKRDISINSNAFVINKKIIDEYPSTIIKNDNDYKKFIVDDSLRYENGCIKTIIYNDCDEFAKQIEKNRLIIEENKLIAESDYKKAIDNNKIISSLLVKQKKNLSDLNDKDYNSLEKNKSEYSFGVSMDGDTIYLRFNKDNPINSDILRIFIHESLHIYSYNNLLLPEAIDEGITDYLSLKAMGYNDLDSIRVAGYPIETQIIMALLDKIELKDLLRVYFNKDEVLLKKLMLKYFPKTKYNEFVDLTKDIFNETYHINGSNRSFNKALIDHEEIVNIRRMLNLPDKKFNVIY